MMKAMQLTPQQKTEFQETVWDYYHRHGRTMPWRDNPDPYWVLVSEIMLQQTQVSRVTPKFEAFIVRFPTISDLAAATLGDVLAMWSGLGYNRRAKFLHQAAQVVAATFSGTLPSNTAELVSLPGIGKNTAGAIMAYAYNEPVLYVETNIRSVYLHHFFADEDDVTDAAILACLDETLDREHPREWYWALMDYGTHIKQTYGNNIKRSKHYAKQSTFAGSRRQIRGKVLKLLLDGPQSLAQINKVIADERLTDVVTELVQEGFIVRDNKDLFRLP